MKTYTEEEVKKLLETQRGNCWVALNKYSKDDVLLEAVSRAPEPGMWREKKEYYIEFEDNFLIDITALPEEINIERLSYEIKNTGLLPIESTTPVEKLKVPISKETKDFLNFNCNIERNKYGESTYILNNLRFKIY